MAGHSQFKNIMHRKGRQDAVRSKMFSKLAREITVAAKQGIADPTMNPRLRLAIQNARAESMPKDNIQRAINTFNLPATVGLIREGIARILAHDCIPMTIGGDHTLTYPVLQAVADKHGPVALIHVDAHADINDTMFGEKIAHGTPFRRAYEAGCLKPDLVFQIGLRGTGYTAEDFDWSRDKGFTVVQAEECWHKSLAPLIADINKRIGSHKTYLSFDIDSLDPAYAPGTGTPEIGGLTVIQGIELIRGCRGLNLVGCDLVEVSPPFDTTGTTAITAANLLYEMLCVLPGVKYKDA